jgi:SAM-dependent methyltransferase
MRKNYFDERIAASYESKWPHLFEPASVDPVVSFLARLAGAGPILELGIGTGRIALPLSQRGIAVHGIDLRSHDRAAAGQARRRRHRRHHRRLRHHHSGRHIHPCLPAARNTIENLTTQDDQVACFRNAASQLEPGGCFVIEVEVPALQRLPPGETIRAFTVTPAHLGFDEYDTASQGLISHHYWVQDDGKLEVMSAPFRYVWPSELDLVARLAGMILRERYSGWNREPFTRDSTTHISVWQKNT